MSDNANVEDSLAAAFNSSFSMPEAAPRPAAAVPATADEAVVSESTEATEGEGEGPDWRPEYEAKLAMWREEADVARAKAEATRAAFEAEHAAEAAEAAAAERARKEAEKAAKEAAENEARLAAELADAAPRAGPIHKRVHAEDRAAKVKEAWELVGARKEAGKQSTAPPSATSVTASQWEEISAPHSSVEDISAATTSAPQSLSPASSKEKESLAPTSTSTSPASSPAAPAAASLVPTTTPAAQSAITTPSLTLSLFTAPNGLTLSRVLAALGINLLLPFINGIMLGLGEITAREGVRISRLWWKGERSIFGHWRRKDGGASTASVGLSGSGGF